MINNIEGTISTLKILHYNQIEEVYHIGSDVKEITVELENPDSDWPEIYIFSHYFELCNGDTYEER